MTTSGTRWVTAAGWMVAMTCVWTIFVPDHLSVVVFALVASAALFVAVCGAALLSDSQAPRSVTAILADLESRGRARATHPDR